MILQLAAQFSLMQQQELLTEHMVTVLSESMELAQTMGATGVDMLELSPEAVALLEAELPQN
jgi:hypothetical protein